MLKARSLLLMLLVVAVVSSTPAAGLSPADYEATDLGVIGPGPYGESAAADVNSRGLVVGRSAINLATPTHLVVWQDRHLTDLGTFPGSEMEWVQPMAVNNRGQIVGYIFEPEESPGPGNPPLPGFNVHNTAGFLYENGAWTLIKAEGSLAAKAVDVNARGQVLGSEYHPEHGLRTFIWENGEFSYLDGLALDYPTAINDRGQVVGWYWDDTDNARSILWSERAVVEIDTPGVETYVEDINNAGQAVGSYYLDGTRRAFILERGEVKDLPVLTGAQTSGATAINERGLVVGYVTAGPDLPTARAVIWHGGTVTQLASFGYGCSAAEVNARGQVVGVCGLDYGPRAFLWER